MLHGAAKLAREKSLRRTRKRRRWIAALSSILLITLAFSAVSHWWTMGLVWCQSPMSATPLPPNVLAISALRTFTLSRWKFHVHTQQFTTPTPTNTSLMYVIERSNTPSTRLPPGATQVSKANHISVPVWITLFPILLPLAFLVDAERSALQRAKRGCCIACGYNLKGIEPVSNLITCPECGKTKAVRPKNN